MAPRITISSGLSVDTGQPTRDELQRLGADGFKSVVNLRMPGEQNQPLQPDAEEAVVRAAGLDYFHIPVPGTGPEAEQVDRFKEALLSLPTPVLVHCASGKRSGVLGILQLASESGMSGEQVLAKAAELGFDWKSPHLEAFVRTYLEQRR